MDPDSIAEENEKKRNEANSANPSTSLSPEQGGTQLSGTAAPAPVTPTTSTASQSAPTKTGATTQANIGGFQQANQAKIAALGNITNQRLQERVGAANQAIAGQKAARVEDVNAQTYAGPKTASLEDLGANESLQTTLAGAGRKSDITNAAKQVAGFGAYDELKNLANNAGSKAYAGNLGLTGGSTDNLLSRSNAATQQGLREQTKGVQNTLKAEQVGALNSVKAAGENVNKANEASVKEIDTNLLGQATAAEIEGQKNLTDFVTQRETEAVANANADVNAQKAADIAKAQATIARLNSPQYLMDKLGINSTEAQALGWRDLGGEIKALQDKLTALNAAPKGPIRFKQVAARAASAEQRAQESTQLQNQIANLQKQAQAVSLQSALRNQANAEIAAAQGRQGITSFDQALRSRALTPAEYDRIQQGKQGLNQAKQQLSNKGTGLSSLSKEKQAGYEALSRILKDPSKLAKIDTGAGSFSNFQELLKNVR